MVRSDHFSFWSGNLFARAAYRALSHVRRHSVRCALLYGTGAIEPKFDTVHARLLVMLLAFAQPLVRGWSRYFTWLHFKRTPQDVIRAHEHLPAGVRVAGSLSRRNFWSEEGRDRHYFSARSSVCSMKKAGVIPPTAGGMNGTFTFTAISGGASRCKPLLNITATGNA